MQFPFGPTLWYKPWWKILFIEWPIIKREVAICKFVSFFFLAKLELQCACPLFFPSNKIIWFSELAICKLVSFFFLAYLEVCMCLSSHTPPTHIHFFGSHKRCDLICTKNENKICLTTALAVLNWLKLSFAYHLHKDQNTPKKNSSRNQSSAKSLEVVSYKLASQSARRLAKTKDLMTCHELWPKHILKILLKTSYCMIWT